MQSPYRFEEYFLGLFLARTFDNANLQASHKSLWQLLGFTLAGSRLLCGWLVQWNRFARQLASCAQGSQLCANAAQHSTEFLIMHSTKMQPTRIMQHAAGSTQHVAFWAFFVFGASQSGNYSALIIGFWFCIAVNAPNHCHCAYAASYSAALQQKQTVNFTRLSVWRTTYVTR